MAEAAINSTSEKEMNVNATDEIASLLIGGEETEAEQSESEVEAEVNQLENDDKEGAEEPTDESTEEVEESDDTEEQSEEEDQTWAGVLGLDDAKVVLDEEGDFAGVNVKVDGQTSTVDMESLVMGYQTNKHNANTSKALAEEKREFETVRDDTVQEYTKRLEDVGKLTEYLNSTLTREFQGINWDQLRMENPAEYAASMQDFNARKQEIDNIYSAIGQERNMAAEKATGEQSVKSNEHIGQQVNRMIENNPTWSDKEVLREAFDSMSEFVTSTYGVPKSEFDEIVDSRMIELIKDAQKYHKGQKIASKKILKPVPKFQKSTIGKVRKKVTKLDKLTKRAKSSTGQAKRSAQTDAIAELLQGG